MLEYAFRKQDRLTKTIAWMTGAILVLTVANVVIVWLALR